MADHKPAIVGSIRTGAAVDDMLASTPGSHRPTLNADEGLGVVR